MEIVKREGAAKKGVGVNEAEIAAMKRALTEQIDAESDPYFATARLWDDGLIDPRESRTVLAIAFAAACNAGVRGTTEWGVFRH
jgi:acetyl-CoA carboxylase carboxyltransferase component